MEIQKTSQVLAIHEKALATKTGLVLASDTTYDEWEGVGKILGQVEGAVHWWIGDWLNFGEAEWGEMYTQALDETGYANGTLRKDKYIAGRFELFRRRNNLPWSHHAEVADMEEEDQEILLDKAEKEGWSNQRLRKEKRNYKRLKSLPSPEEMEQSSKFQLIHDEFENAAQEIEPGSIDAIITDPPYPEEYLYLYGILAREAKRLLKPGGSLLVMTGQSYLPQIMEMMTAFMTYQWTLSYLTPGGQSPQIWQRKVNTFWKPIIWFINGEYDGDWIGDVCKSAVNDNDKRYHDWGQSESGMTDLVHRFTYPGDLILDPFCGAGTTGIVSLEMGRRFIGIDKDRTAIETSASRIALWQKREK